MAEPERDPKEERREILIFATEHARVDMVSACLEEERKDPAGDVPELLATRAKETEDTALHVACRLGLVDVVRVLLLRGAKADLRNAADLTALEVVAQFAPVQSRAAVKAAFEAELFKCCASGDTSGALALLAGGLDLECTQAGYTPVSWAELFEQWETARRIKEPLQLDEVDPAPDHSAAESPKPSEQGIAVNGVECSTLASEAADADGGNCTVTPELSRASKESVCESEFYSNDRAQLQQPTPVYCRRLPLLWPPVLEVPDDGGEPSSSSTVELPLVSEASIHVLLPIDLEPSASKSLLDTLECAFREVLRSMPAAKVSQANAPFALGLPLLAPQREGMWACEDIDLLWPLGDDTGVNGCHAYRAALDRLTSIRFAIDPSVAYCQGNFRIAITPGHHGSFGHIEVVGFNTSALQAACQILHQVFRQGIVDLRDGLLQLPSVVLEAADCGVRRQERIRSIFLDIWQLAREEADLVLDRLRHWRVNRLFVPLPDTFSGCDSRQPGPERLRRIFELCQACHRFEIVLVPVLTLSPEQSLFEKTAANGVHCSQQRRYTQIIADILAQFSTSQLLGVRFEASSSNTDDCNHKDRNAVCNAGAILCRLQEIRRLALAVGMGGPRGASLLVWLAAEDTDLLAKICASLPSGSLGQRSRLGFMLTTRASRDDLPQVSKAVGVTSSYGMPVHIFAAADRSIQEVPELHGLSLAHVPSFVWPTVPVSTKAKELAGLCALGDSQVSVQGMVVEVPVHGPPWHTSSRAPHTFWCVLTAFLAAGLGQDPDLGLSAIGNYKSKKNADMAGQLGQLLSLHLLGLSQSIKGSSGDADEMQVTAKLARAIWDVTPSLASSKQPPSWLLPMLLGLLAGKLLIPESANRSNEAVVAATNEWYLHLSDRKASLRDCLERIAESGTSSCCLSSDCVAPPAAAINAAIDGVEALRFACRLLLLLVKHTDYMAGQLQTGELREVKAAIDSLPPGKVSDVRNGFLSIVERASGIEDALSEEAVLPWEAAAPLWRAGLRLGAALDMEPWVQMHKRSLDN